MTCNKVLLQIVSLLALTNQPGVLALPTQLPENVTSLSATTSNVTVDPRTVNFWRTFWSGVHAADRVVQHRRPVLPMVLHAKIKDSARPSSKLLTDFKPDGLEVFTDTVVAGEPQQYVEIEMGIQQDGSWGSEDSWGIAQSDYSYGMHSNLFAWKFGIDLSLDPWTLLAEIQSSKDVPGEIADAKNGPWTQYIVQYREDPVEDVYLTFFAESGNTVNIGLESKHIFYQVLRPANATISSWTLHGPNTVIIAQTKATQVS